MTSTTPEPDEPDTYDPDGWRAGQEVGGLTVDDQGIPTNAEYQIAYDDDGTEVGVELVDDSKGGQDDDA